MVGQQWFEKVGLIAQHFEQCEYYLAVIFDALCESDNGAPFAAFGHIVSSNTRLAMVKEAAIFAFPRKAALRCRLGELCEEFKQCQALRNRSVHASLLPEFTPDGVAWHGRPLWHQSMRYKNGAVKPASRFTFEDLCDAEFRTLCLALDMKAHCAELVEFLAMRKSRRARSKMPRSDSPRECR